MKTEAAVRHKLRQVLFRHLKFLLAGNFQKTPLTCAFNGKPRTVQVPRMCLYGATTPGAWLGKVCDPQVEGCQEQARSCPFWKPLRTREEIKAEFKALVSKNRAAVAAQFPDAAALLWVLEEEVVPGDIEITEDPEGLGEPAPESKETPT